MSLPAIRIVDVQHNNERVFLEDLTHDAIGSLIYECERLLDELKDAADATYEREENET